MACKFLSILPCEQRLHFRGMSCHAKSSRLLFAWQLTQRKCSLCSQGISILAPYHFFNLLLFKETPNLIPNSFAVFKYFPRYLVCLGKFNTLLNFRRPGVSYTFNSFNKLISFIYLSSSSDTYILCTLPDNLLTVGHTRKYGYGKSLKLITYHKSLTSIPPHHAH